MLPDKAGIGLNQILALGLNQMAIPAVRFIDADAEPAHQLVGPNQEGWNDKQRLLYTVFACSSSGFWRGRLVWLESAGSGLLLRRGSGATERRVQVIFQSHVVGHPVRFSPGTHSVCHAGVEHKNVYQFRI